MTTARNESEIEDRLSELAEQFSNEHRQGKRPAIEAYAAQYPELAERIRQLFPALVVIEELGPLQDSGPPAAEFLPSPSIPLQIGDYRIIREIGRGGMGIVFEAEQISLVRPVALKVLGHRASLDPRLIERFQVEARSAGRLHHPRIIPVYDVGEADGIHFYAMQRIDGMGLDQALSELRTLTCLAGAQTTAAQANGMVTVLDRGSGLGLRSAESRNFGLESLQVPSPLLQGRDPIQVPSPPRRGRGQGVGVFRTRHERRSPLTFNDDRRHPYYRDVARIGMHAAESLAYAHAEGILHRDIKPSNLILDRHGEVWVADFGLAKAFDTTDPDGQGGLTGTGDLVGTMRYMAPERFRGWSDPRSDVYALGLTLYELLAQRPAFEEGDRVKLIQDIKDVEPPRPRTFDVHIPLDLETIVLKAMQKEPARRYQTAGELAEDLQRFLEHRPIAARRVTRTERVAQWTRRNPALAAALVSVAGLLLIVAVGSSLLSWRLNRALNTSTTLLRQSLLDQARSMRSSATPGGRTLALDALRQAAAIRPGLDLRNEAIAAMARTDIQPVPERTLPPARATLVFGLNLEYSLADDGKGLAFVRDANGKELQRIPVGRLWYALASPDNRFLIVKDGINRSGVGPERIRVFEWRSGRQILQLDGGGDFDFRPDGKEFVVANNHGAGEVVFYNLPRGTELRRFRPSRSVILLKYHPSGGYLAFCEQGKPAISRLDAQSGTIDPLGVKSHGGLMSQPSFDESGKRVAAGASNWQTYVWDTGSGDLTATLTGHGAEVARTDFVPNSEILATSSWDRSIRLWDSQEGRALARLNGGLLGVSSDGKQLAFQNGNQVGIVRIVAAREYRSLRGHTGKNPRSCCFAPDGRTLVSCGYDGVRIWDIGEGKCLGTIALEGTLSVKFTSAMDSLLTAASAGLYRWPVRHSADQWVLGPREALIEETVTDRRIALSPEQDRIAVASDATDRLEIVSLSDRTRRSIPCNALPNDCRFSPDGSWVFARSWRGQWWAVYDAGTLLPVRKRFAKVTQACFSPDSRRLIAATTAGVEVWETASWKLVQELPWESSGIPWVAISFSPDGALLAVSGSDGAVWLLHGGDYHEVARLESPSPQHVHDVVFDSIGSQLAVCANGAINIWDLRAIRESLAEMHLDWSPPPAPRSRVATAAPIQIVIDDGELGRDP